MSNAPIEKFADGAAKADVFQSRNGNWLEVSLGRVYKKGDEFKRSNSYSLNQAKQQLNALTQAVAFMEANQPEQANDAGEADMAEQVAAE